MSKRNDLFNLPIGLELCFDKNDFMKSTFSADKFLQEHRNVANLETMRDDLGIYLKALRSAMIELINEDYADFVNLSSNLIGLDQSIGGIQTPLKDLREEILNVKFILTETMNELSNGLAQKRMLRQHLKSIDTYEKVQKQIYKITNLINNNNDTTDTNIVDNNKLVIQERAALELIHLEFHRKFCENLLTDVERMNIRSLHSSVLQKIEKYFLQIIKQTDDVNTRNTNTSATNNLDNLEHCLRVYCTMNKCSVAEEIYRKEIIAPHMYSIISENSLQNSPQGLSGIYRQILEFITIKMNNLILLCHHQKQRKIKGFNFIINSFWIEIEKQLETNMSSIFAPGNPDLFYQKYKVTMEFLNELERIIGNDTIGDDNAGSNIMKFRNHPQYKSFQTRWNLPVYFQIRFQEIGGAVETSCNLPITMNLINQQHEFNVKPILIAFTSIMKCWSDGIYLPQLFIKFLKLTMQILSRLSIWIDECIKQLDSTRISERTDFLVLLYLDIKLITNKVSTILFNDINEKSPENFKPNKNNFERCLEESRTKLNDNLISIEKKILREIIEKSIIYIKHVGDIPRLYRKTNRDVPTKACSYVEQIFESIKAFQKQYIHQFDTQKMSEILCQIFSQLNIRYCSAVEDVLTSVQKTEESLRRLKNLREKQTFTDSTVGSVTVSSTEQQRVIGMNDDDKIRLQLLVDVNYWTKEIESLNVRRDQVTKLQHLIYLVEEATKTNNKK